LYLVTLQSFAPDARWAVSSTNSSLSLILRKMWLLAEPVTAAGLSPALYLANAPPVDLSTVMPSVVASFLKFESNKFAKLDSSAVACDTSSVTEGRKSVVVLPSSSSYFALQQVTLSVRVLPALSVLSSRVSSAGNSKFLFKIKGLDPNFTYQLICTFRSTLTSNVYSRAVNSHNGPLSIFACVTPVVDSVGTSWTFGVSSTNANFSLVEPSQILVIDELRLNATDVDTAVGRSIPVSFLSDLKESLVCKFSAPLTATPRCLELVGGAWATVPAPPPTNLGQFSVSLWIKVSPAIKDDAWTDVLSAYNFFSIAVSRSGQSSALGNSAIIKFCAQVLIDSVSSEKCVFSSPLSISNVWTHIFAGVDGSAGDIVLAVNGQQPYIALKVFQFNLIYNVSNVIVLGQKSVPFEDTVPYDGLIDNIRMFSELVSPNLVSEMYQRSFSSYPPVNLIMSLTFDDNEGRDEVSGKVITTHKLPHSNMTGQWFSTCVHFASQRMFSYSTLYNETYFVSRIHDYTAIFGSR